jgi:hypothetical protein
MEKQEGRRASHQMAFCRNSPGSLRRMWWANDLFFPMLWALIMWDFVCINAGLRPLVERSSSSSEWSAFQPYRPDMPGL